MIVKGCLIFERTQLSRKKSHNLAWSCVISSIFYCATITDLVLFENFVHCIPLTGWQKNKFFSHVTQNITSFRRRWGKINKRDVIDITQKTVLNYMITVKNLWFDNQSLILLEFIRKLKHFEKCIWQYYSVISETFLAQNKTA